ncbi:MAG: efflux RND transporter permease subunit, partial [Myxococcales bacterium]|nr:efflux RND transporter permease subunit [Myxococcales bacterium]
MDLIRGSIRFPHTVIVATILLLLFGAISLRRVPLQMRPTIDNPEITVTTRYPGAAPEEIEDKITRPIEEALNSVEGLKKLSSTSMQGFCRVTLEFDWGTNRDAAMVDVLNKLGRVKDWPEGADKPVAEAISSDTSSPVMWIAFQATDPKYDNRTDQMRQLIDDVIEPRMRRIEGVGSLIIAGGREREVQVRVNLRRLAQLKISLSRLIGVIRANNSTVRGGPLESGKREYIVWTTGRARTLRELRDIVVQRNQDAVVRLGDIAEIVSDFKVRDSIMRLSGRPGNGVGILRKTGANVPKVAVAAANEVKKINAEFKEKGLPFRLKILFTEMTYIEQSVNLVVGNLYYGGALAVLVLLVFLGSLRSVLVIAISIPVCLLGVFIMIDVFGRSLNIISMAGLAFAVGMVVDNAIVVLENIHRYIDKPWSMEEICYHGTREVGLAIAASTLTTVAVFLPVVFLQSEAGQLFKDIALSISFAVGFSLILSLTLVPMLSRLILKKTNGETSRFQRVFERYHPGRFFDWLYAKTLDLMVGPGKAFVRVGVVLAVAAGFIASLTLLPAAEYLPSGNRNMIITLASPLPGSSLSEVERAARPIETFLVNHPKVERIFTVFGTRFNAIGAVLKDEYSSPEHLNGMLATMRKKTAQIAGFQYMFPIKASIFRNPGKQFEIDIFGPDLKRLAGFANVLTQDLRNLPGVLNVRSSHSEGGLSIDVKPRHARLAERGMTGADLADVVQVALGGLRVGFFLEQGREVDLTLISPPDLFPSILQLADMPLVNNAGKLFYLSDVGVVRREITPTTINRLEMNRAITLTVNLAPTVSLGGTMDRVEENLLKPLRSRIPTEYSVLLGDTADKLNETLGDIKSSFLLALLISYLLMVALFRSFWYPFIIITTVPMAATGAFVGV